MQGIAWGQSGDGLPVTAQERPAWMDEEVVQAAMQIGMTEAQRPEFRNSVTVFLQSYGEAVSKIVRRGGADLENTIRRKRNTLAREMDERMATFLGAEQMPAYQNYRDLLLSKLSG